MCYYYASIDQSENQDKSEYFLQMNHFGSTPAIAQTRRDLIQLQILTQTLWSEEEQAHMRIMVMIHHPHALKTNQTFSNNQETNQISSRTIERLL